MTNEHKNGRLELILKLKAIRWSQRAKLKQMKRKKTMHSFITWCKEAGFSCFSESSQSTILYLGPDHAV